MSKVSVKSKSAFTRYYTGHTGVKKLSQKGAKGAPEPDVLSERGGPEDEEDKEEEQEKIDNLDIEFD